MSKESVNKLLEYAEMVNIAEDLSDEKLLMVAKDVMNGFEEDERSTDDWRKTAKRALELTSLEREVKNFPRPNASNVKYPLITTAALQFASRTLPELLKGGDLVKYKILGKDKDGKKDRAGKRIKEHMNWQLLHQMTDWLDSHDRLLMHLSVVGTVFAKTYFDEINGVPASQFIPYDEVIVNNSIANLEDAERISHLLFLSQRELTEYSRFGLYKELPEEALEEDESDTVNVQELIEQHCFLDLDEDGYAEPYVVVMHKSSETILRIAPRYNVDSIVINDDQTEVMKIYGKNYFSDYHFIHDPAGGFHSLGWGGLLLDMQEVVNTISNQLIDSGYYANLQGGFIGAGMRMRAKSMQYEPGEFKVLESSDGQGIRNNVVPLPFKEPSNVLFQLLGMVIGAAKELTSTTDALLGNSETQNVSPHALRDTIQQGLKVYTAIQKRVFRGYGKEFKKLVDLNKVHLDPDEYMNIIDPSIEERQEIIDPETRQILDYINSGLDIVPVADASASTEAERAAKSQALMSGGIQLAQIGAVPNPTGLTFDYLSALESEHIELIMTPPQQDNGPDPQIVELQSKLDKTAKELEFREKELELKLLETQAKITKMESESIKNIADAEAAESGSQLQQYQAIVSGISEVNTAVQEMRQVELDREAQANANQEQPTDGPETPIDQGPA